MLKTANSVIFETRGEAKSKIEKELLMKRMLEAKRIAKSQEQRTKDLQKTIDNRKKALEEQQMVSMGKEQFNKNTHLQYLKRIFGISYAELASLKQINGMLHSHLSRVPAIFPRYNSCWIRIVYLCLNKCESLADLEQVGYFQIIGLEEQIKSELENVNSHFGSLEGELCQISVDSFKFAYKLGLDLDMDFKISAGLSEENVWQLGDPKKAKGSPTHPDNSREDIKHHDLSLNIVGAEF